MSRNIILTTTQDVPGREVTQLLDIVSGQAIVGAHIFKDLFAAIRDVIGGRSGSYEQTLKGARDMALDDLRREAASLQADAVVGVHFSYETVGKGGSMLMVSVSGTAARLR